MTHSVSDLLWLLLGAVLGTTVLALIVAALAAPAVQVLKRGQRVGLLLVSVLTLWVALAGTGILLRSRNLPTVNQRPEPESSLPPSSTARVSQSSVTTQTAQPLPAATRNSEIFSVPATETPPPPTTPLPQPISKTLTTAAPGRMPTADDWVQYQDLRGIRAERRIRLGDARFVKKGGRYYVDFGKISGLPNELEVVASDQEKVRFWLGE